MKLVIEPDNGLYKIWSGKQLVWCPIGDVGAVVQVMVNEYRETDRVDRDAEGVAIDSEAD
jgi:hypothetical protein